MRQAKPNNNRAADRRLQRWALPLLAVLVILAVGIILRFMNEETTVQIREDVFQFFSEQRTKYSEGTTMLQGKYNLILKSGDEESSADPTPLYSESSSALYISRNSCWLDPANGDSWYIPAMSRLEEIGDTAFYLTVGKQTAEFSGGIISDCEGTYLFLDYVELSINGRKLELAPLSFCSISDDIVRVYNYGTDELRCFEEQTTNITATARRNYHVDLSIGIYTGPTGKYRLLVADPTIMPEIISR